MTLKVHDTCAVILVTDPVLEVSLGSALGLAVISITDLVLELSWGSALQLQLSWGSALQLISALRPLSKSCSTRQKSLNRPFPAFVGLQALNFCRSRDTVFAHFRRSHPLPFSDQAAHLQGLRARQQSLTVSCRSLRISFWLSPALMFFARSSRVFCVPLLVVLSFGEAAAG